MRLFILFSHAENVAGLIPTLSLDFYNVLVVWKDLYLKRVANIDCLYTKSVGDIPLS